MNAQNTPTPVATTSDLWPVHVVGMGESPRQREKAAVTGEPTYSSGCVLIGADKDGNDRAQKTASIHVIKPASVYALGERFVSKGRVYVMPYESNGRVALSITVEELVPVRSGQAGEQK